MSGFDNLMPIRTKGTKPPLFCVHGEPLQIALRIRADRPLYGVSLLYHPRLGNLGPDMPDTVEQYAQPHFAYTRKMPPRGPDYPSGFSAGRH